MDGQTDGWTLIRNKYTLFSKIKPCIRHANGWSAVAHLVERQTGDQRVASLRLTSGGFTVLFP